MNSSYKKENNCKSIPLSLPIPIKHNNNNTEIINIKGIDSKNICGLVENNFNPTASSPPDDFMQKLEKRMNKYKY